MAHPQSEPQSRLTPENRAALYELSRRTNRQLLIVTPVILALFILLLTFVDPAVRGGMAGLGGALGVGIALILGRSFTKLRTELGLSVAEARAIVAEERTRRKK